MSKSPKRRTRLGDRNAVGIRNQDLGEPVDSVNLDAAGITPVLDSTTSSSPRNQPGTADEAAARQATTALTEQSAPAPGPVTVPAGEGTLSPAMTAEHAPELAPEPEVDSWPVAEIPGGQEAQSPAEDSPADEEPEATAEAAEAAVSAPEEAAPPQGQPEPQPAEAPAEEETVMTTTVEKPRAAAPRPALVADENAVKGLDRYADSRNKSRSATDQITVTITNEALVDARRAYTADQDNLDPHPSSFAKWIQRAVHIHVHRSPQERAEVLAEAKRRWTKPESGERKKSYNVPMPYDLHLQLQAAVPQERKAGRLTSKSEIARDAMFIEMVAASERAGGELPVMIGKLPHAR